MMKVADIRPASCPSVASSTSMSKPRRSAQREYMRSIISAQSWASVPPAPAWISATASPSSYFPANNERSSRMRSRRSRSARTSSASGRRDGSSSSSSSSLRVCASESCPASAANSSRSSVTRPSSVVTARALSASSHSPGSDAACSSSALRSFRRSTARKRPASSSRSAKASNVTGMSTRSGSPAPLREPSAGAISVCAVAELVLLTAVAPAGIVAADLLAVRLHDGELGLAVVGHPTGHAGQGAVALVHDGGRLLDLRRGGRGQCCGDASVALNRVVGGEVVCLLQVRFGGRLGQHLDVEDVAEIVVADPVHQLPEHGEALALVGDQRVLIAHGPKVDPLPQVVHVGQVVLPPLVDDLEHDVALELTGDLLAPRDGLVPLRIQIECLGEDALGDLVHRAGTGQVVGHELGRVVLGQLDDQLGKVPLLGVVRGARGDDQPGNGVLEELGGLLAQVLAVDDLEAPTVDDLALLVHHVVVLEHVLARFGVATLNGVLCPLDGLGDHLRLDGHLVGEGPTHHPVHCTGGEQPHEVILEREEEPALPRVALTTGASPELVVDPSALVTLAPQHVEPSEGPDLVALAGAGGLELGVDRLERRLALVGGHVDAPRLCLTRCQAIGIAPEDDVDSTAGHVGGHGHRTDPTGLRHDLRLTEVLLGVEDLVGDALLLQQAGEVL